MHQYFFEPIGDNIMYQKTFSSTEETLQQELWEGINDAESLGIISVDTAAELWYFKDEGMAWLNNIKEEA